MKKLFLLFAFCSLLLVTGCIGQQVPKTVVSGSIGGQPFSISNPKDTTLNGLKVAAGTNGTASIEIESLTTVMNPNVITETGKAQTSEISARGEAATQVISALSNLAGAAGQAVATGGTSIGAAKALQAVAARGGASVPASRPDVTTNAPAN